jgi:serine/threonine protein kinase
LEKIGKGGFGGVYRAQHQLTHELVAMKTLNLDTTDDKQREYYHREICALATFKHPTILPLIGCTPFNQPDGLSIVMPLMKTSVQHYINLERNNKTPTEWTPTRKHIILIGIAVGMMLIHKEK